MPPPTSAHPTKSRAQHNHKKLSRLPATHQISKRPLLHPAIPSPHTSALTPKIIYISTSSPFIAILKRVKKLLGFVEGRAAGDLQLVNGRNGREVLSKIEAAVAGLGGGRGGRSGKGKGKGSAVGGGNGNGGRNPREEEIQLRATGRAIQKALQIAVSLQQEEGLRVRFETASVGAVDDVVEKASVRKEVKGTGEEGKEDVEAEDGNAMDVDGDKEEDIEIEESRVRRVSCLIIFVGLK